MVAVASTPVKDNSAGERLRAERVCRIKALAYLVQEQTGSPSLSYRGVQGQDRSRKRQRQGTRDERLRGLRSHKDQG